MGSSDCGSAPRRSLDPELVFLFVRHRRAQGLFNYLELVTGARADLQCRLVSFAGMALRALRLGSPPYPDEEIWASYWAEYARAHARLSSIYAPQMAGTPVSCASDPDASSSSTSTARLPPQQTNYNAVINSLARSNVSDFAPSGTDPTLDRRHAAINNQLEASSSSTPTAMLPPQWTNYNSDFSPGGTDPTLELKFAKLSLGQPGSEQMAPQELMQNNPAMGLPSMRQPSPAQLTPQRLMQNSEVDIKGKGPASEVDRQKVLVRVATLVKEDSTLAAAGLLIKKEDGQFLCASYFLMPVREAVLLLAAACCEGIKIARAYQPSSIVLESHLCDLLNPYLAGAAAPCAEMVEFMNLLDSPHCTVGSITEEQNLNARQLAFYSLADGQSDIFFDVPPHWFVLE